MRCPIVVIALAVTWLLEPTFASRPWFDMFLAPENLNDYYVEEKGSKHIQCNYVTEKDIKVNLTWIGPSVNTSNPQLTSFVPQGTKWQFGNWLNITQFSDADAGKYKCTAKTSTGFELPRPITINKSCDIGKFGPPSCKKNCSKYCKPMSDDGVKGRTCNHMTGSCLDGCQEGYTGLLCTEPGGSRDAKLAWIAVPITLVIIIIFVVCVVPKTGKPIRQKLHACWRREKQPRRSEEANSRDVIHKEEGTSLLDLSPAQNNSRQGNGPENSTGTVGQRGGVTPNGNSVAETEAITDHNNSTHGHDAEERVDGARLNATSGNATETEERTSLLDLSPDQNNSRQGNGPENATGTGGQRGGVTPNGNSVAETEAITDHNNSTHGHDAEERVDGARLNDTVPGNKDILRCLAVARYRVPGKKDQQCNLKALDDIIFCANHKRTYAEKCPDKSMSRDLLRTNPNLLKDLVSIPDSDQQRIEENQILRCLAKSTSTGLQCQHKANKDIIFCGTHAKMYTEKYPGHSVSRDRLGNEPMLQTELISLPN